MSRCVLNLCFEIHFLEDLFFSFLEIRSLNLFVESLEVEEFESSWTGENVWNVWNWGNLGISAYVSYIVVLLTFPEQFSKKKDHEGKIPGKNCG